MSGSAAFFEAVKARRSIYTIGSESTIPDEKIEEIIATAVKHAPSSFNIQSSRAVLLLGDEHKKLWEITLNVLKGIVPADQLPATEGKINGCFAAGHGTVLFFEDQDGVKDLQTRFPLYQDRFPTWSEHASGILQYIIWTALEAEGLGASLQHYNPLISAQVLDTWKLPTSWVLVAQLPFGKPTAPAGEKTFEPIEGKRFLTFGKQ
ncbi:Nitroreductase [Trametes versicolor FP-101664 SS1]|uniref:Nitroreductase n=1 Tax=Trametes versicolor (strain FP-101664) TaxID=717944 RepID=UPI0004622266|nr:Nitroreductase [Trametes versicolor FP-101664 SS1]EIW54373.1 Nitroreductase [Trametes versicolor FP-101664 SS1]